MDTLWQDIRYAFRSFVRQPAQSAAIVVALALGIGANSVIFSVVDAVLLHPMALQNWREPDRVLMLWEKNSSLSLFFANQIPARPQNFRAWREQSHAFEQLAAWQDIAVTLTHSTRAEQKPESVEMGAATANLFPLLGIRPAIGRNFSASDVKDKRPVALISDELYRGRFADNSQVLGTTLVANEKSYTIVGVLPPNVAFPAIWGGMEQKKPKLWIPLDEHPPKKEDEQSSLFVFGRLKDGVSLAAAQAEMQAVQGRLAHTPLEEGGFSINVVTLREANTDPSLRRAVLVLQISVGLVLLIACANAANLLLTRAIARDKEIAVRSAIGATSSRLFRQAITESMLLSGVAALLGLLFSWAGIRVLMALAPKDTFALHELRIDSPVLLFTVGVALATGLIFGLVPAQHSLSKNISRVLNRSTRSVAGTSAGLRNGLVIAEIALSMLLVIGGGLMIRSLIVMMNADLGFKIDHLLVMRVSLPGAKYKNPEQLFAFDSRLLDSMRNLAGVESAAITTALPLKSVSQSSFEIPGRPTSKDKIPVSDWARVSDAYFETLHMPVLKGRTFTRQEATAANPEVAVVNQAFAHTFFPGSDPIGQTVKFGNEKGEPTTYRLIGIVGNEHQMGPDNAQASELYLPGSHLNDFLLVARTKSDPLRLANDAKQQVWNIDKEQPVNEVMSEENALREWNEPRRFNLIVLMTFAGIALLLAAMGLYSVLAYSVTLRTREIGIRMALGAEPAAVARFILKGGLLLSLVGIAIGLTAAVTLTRFLANLICGVNALDPFTFATVSFFLLLVAALASYLPAIRAARIDPIKALRVE